MFVITAHDGKLLREFADTMKGKDDIAVFPEAGLSPNEQAAFIKDNAGKFKTVITFSPFIISDADKVDVIDAAGGPSSDLKAASANKITMKLWRKETISDIAMDNLKGYYEQIRQAETLASLEDLDNSIYNTLGDSVERVLLLNSLYSREDELKKKEAGS